MSLPREKKRLFERLKAGLEECILHAKGELSLRTIEMPDAPPDIDGKAIADMREKAAMSQSVFAKVLNVSTKTVQSWEQGARKPSDASRRLIQIFKEHPEIVCQTAGLTTEGSTTTRARSAAIRRKKNPQG